MNPLILLAQAEPDVATGFGLFAGMGAAMMIVMLILTLACAAFILWMLVDALANEPDPMQKLVWAVVIFLFPLIGAIVYFAVRKSARTRTPTAG